MIKKMKTSEIKGYKVKLDDKIKALNSTRVYKKVTPLHDSTWYVKWISVGFIICAVMCRSIEEVPKIYDVFFSIFGTAGWLWVGFRWHDRALMVLNAILLFLLLSSFVRFIVVYLI